VRVYALRLEDVADRPASSAAPAKPIPQSAKVPRLSIVVLPFAHLSNDPEQQYLAEGITEDLTTDLSRIAGMVVISRTTAFTYRNRPIDIRQIGRELNMRYVLEGSIRRSGDRLRCNAQLIDAESDSHIWAERFDLLADDLFWLQDEVTGRIAIALDVELVKTEAARRSENPDAFDTSCAPEPPTIRIRRASVSPRRSACVRRRWRSIPARSQRRDCWRRR
jgi:TolB-like protein